MWSTVLKNLVYPLLLKAAGWIYDKYLMKETTEERLERQKKREEILKLIKENKDDAEKLRLYSSILADYTRS